MDSSDRSSSARSSPGDVVVGHRGHAVQALAVGRLDEVEADRLEEADRRPVVRPGGRPDRRRAARRGVAHEPRRELRSDATPPVARIDGDHVEHRDRRVVLAQEADRDPDDPAVLACRDPGRPREVPEPEPRKELPGGPAAGPVVEPSDDRVVVGVGRAAVVDRPRPRQRDPLASAGEDAGDDQLDRDEQALDVGEVLDDAEHAALDPGEQPDPDEPERHRAERHEHRRAAERPHHRPDDVADRAGRADESGDDRERPAEQRHQDRPAEADGDPAQDPLAIGQRRLVRRRFRGGVGAAVAAGCGGSVAVRWGMVEPAALAGLGRGGRGRLHRGTIVAVGCRAWTTLDCVGQSGPRYLRPMASAELRLGLR